MKGGILGHGYEHSVFSGTPGYVRKEPKNAPSRTYESVRDSVWYFARFLGKFVPHTRVVSTRDDSYIVLQKEIHGRILATFTEDSIAHESLLQLHQFLIECEHLLVDEGFIVDIFGYIGDEYLALQSSLSKGLDKIRVSSSSLPKPLRAPINLMTFLVWYMFRLRYQGNIFQSTNIMVHDITGAITFVDVVGDVGPHPNQYVNFMNKQFQFLLIKMYQHQVRRVMEKRK